MKNKWHERARAVLHHGVVILVTAVFLLPLYWAFVTSLRAPGLPPPSTIEWWPTDPHWENYSTIFQMLPLVRYISNSLVVVATAVPITLFVASTAGFAMSQLPGKSRHRLFVLSVVLLMIPGMAVWLFRFQILRMIGLVDSRWALIVPAFAATSPLFVLLFYWSFRRVPQEIFEVARLDGATVFAMWWKLARPLARPTAVATLLLSFVIYWSDFVSPVLYIYDPQKYTLPVGLQILKQLDDTNWPLLMAASVVMIVPVLLLFMVVQCYYRDDFSLSTLYDLN